VFDGIPRTKQQIDRSSGGLLGEAARDANKTKILHGLLKEPDINIPVEEEDDGGGDGEDKPKVRTFMSLLYNFEIIFIYWTFNFVFFEGMAIHEFKIPTKYLLT